MRNISTENLNNFKIKKALAQKTLRQAERKYWESFISNLNRFTPETKIWACIKRLNGSSKSNTKNFPVITIDGKNIVHDLEKANALGSFFKSIGEQLNINESNSSSIKTTLYINKENIKLESVLNEDFTMMELEKSLQSQKESTPGNDNIPYQVYKHLPIVSKQTMLKLINNIWNTSQIPAPLKHTILIPIAKPHKTVVIPPLTVL